MTGRIKNKKLEFSEEYIQSRIFFEYERTAKHFFDNIYFFSEKDYEADFLTFIENRRTRELDCTEYEIKVTHSDFLKDFKKELKHENYRKGILCPNYFYYVAPPGIISREELPDFSGLLEVGEKRIRIVKRAPRINDEVIDYTDAFRKSYNRYFDWRKNDYFEVLKHGGKPRRRRKTYGKRRKKRRKPVGVSKQSRNKLTRSS